VAYAAPWESEDSETTVERYKFEGDRGAVQSELTAQTLRDVLDSVEA